METLKKVQEFIQTNELLQPSERILVGVSGGVDSVVLLNILFKSGYECIVAHCNFHLRGSESDRDEKFVEKLAKEYGVMFKKLILTPPGMPEKTKYPSKWLPENCAMNGLTGWQKKFTPDQSLWRTMPMILLKHFFSTSYVVQDSKD